MAAKKPKVTKPSASKIAADKRRQKEEHLAKAKQTAYDKAYKMTMIQAAKAADQAQALKDVEKKAKRR